MTDADDVEAKRKLLEESHHGRELLASIDADDATAAAFAGMDHGEWDTEPPHRLAPYLVDWAELWDADHAGEDWLIKPLFARGRSHALYAGAKSGKSWITLAAVAAACQGRNLFGGTDHEPITCLYVDYEMTAEDVRDRLEDFGYGPEDDLSRLRYAMLPSIGGLDTPEGGSALLEAAQAEGAELVVIDTTGRAVEGEENTADTMRAYYRCTGLPLKAAGHTVVRIDHAGKDVSKGQRGTSAKNDDVDVVWKLVRGDDGHTLTATHRRMSWVPETVKVGIAEDDDGVTRFTSTAGVSSWPAGTKAIADELDAAGVPLRATEREIRRDWRPLLDEMKEAGMKVGASYLRPALKFRQERALEDGGYVGLDAVDNSPRDGATDRDDRRDGLPAPDDATCIEGSENTETHRKTESVAVPSRVDRSENDHPPATDATNSATDPEPAPNKGSEEPRRNATDDATGSSARDGMWGTRSNEGAPQSGAPEVEPDDEGLF